MAIVIKDGIPYETKDTLIDVKAIENNIAKLERDISSLPQQKTKPDQDTLDFWNSMIPKSDSLIIQKEKLESRLSEINRMLEK